MKRFTGQETLEAFIRITPLLNELFPQDIVVAVADTEMYRAYQPGETFDIGLRIGDRIKEGASVDIAMKERKKEVVVIGKEVFGIGYKSIAEPVYDEYDQVIGVVAIAASLENQNKLTEIMEQFSSGFEEVNSSIQEIATGSENLARSSEMFSQATNVMKEDVKKTDNIIRMIREIADQTKLLGLNAAIEAARAGESGRGFAVVANEIRNLSSQSNDSAKEVNDILTHIADSINSIADEVQEISAVSEEQSSSTQQIAAAMQQLVAQVETLGDFVKLV